MASASSKFGLNLLLGRVASFIPYISTSAGATPTDGSADADVNGSLALTSTGLWQRLSGAWVQLATNSNTASGRFVTGTAVFAGVASAVTTAAPAGVSDGDRIVCSQNGGVTQDATAVVMFGGQVVGGNVVITALDNAGAAVATANGCQVYYIIDTAT